MDSKICKKCGLELALTAFHRNGQYSCGYNSRCRTCVNTVARERYHGGYRDMQLAQTRAWMDANYDHFRAYQDQYYGIDRRDRAPYVPRRAPYQPRYDEVV